MANFGFGTLALITLPSIASAGGMTGVFVASSAFAAFGLLLLAFFYRPPATQATKAGSGVWPARAALWAVIAAGFIWVLYNAALAMVLGFGTALLAERGWSLTAAGSATILVLWLVGISVLLGGLIADRTAKPIAVMLVGFALFAVALIIAARAEFVLLSFATLGLVSGLSAGPIVSLPAHVLKPEARAVGMGLYFTIFYAMAVMGPIAAGRLAAQAGSSQAAFDLGAGMLTSCFVAAWIYERVRPRSAPNSSV